MTDVQGRCPACRGASLFLGEGGHVTCARIACPNPSAADDLLHGEHITAATPLICSSERHAAKVADLDQRLHVAEATARHWHQAALDRNDIPAAHAIACIRAALNGETRPDQLGLPELAPDTAATQATDGWEQQDDGTWTLPIGGGIVTVPPTITAEERARFAAAWAEQHTATPAEHCGHPSPDTLLTAPRTECVLRPGHAGSHADDRGCRWRPISAADPQPVSAGPTTITDPAWLREQYAAVIRSWWDDDDQGANEIADAVMRVRDRHLQQLRQRLTLADELRGGTIPAEAGAREDHPGPIDTAHRYCILCGNRAQPGHTCDPAGLRRVYGSLVDRAERKHERAQQLAGVLREVLAQFTHETHPGRRCLQTGHVPIGTVERWRAVLNPQEQP